MGQHSHTANTAASAREECIRQCILLFPLCHTVYSVFTKCTLPFPKCTLGQKYHISFHYRPLLCLAFSMSFRPKWAYFNDRGLIKAGWICLLDGNCQYVQCATIKVVTIIMLLILMAFSSVRLRETSLECCAKVPKAKQNIN